MARGERLENELARAWGQAGLHEVGWRVIRRRYLVCGKDEVVVRNGCDHLVLEGGDVGPEGGAA
jgi:hypothetical protein